MAEPTNGELMVHLIHIRNTTDRLEAAQLETQKTVTAQGLDIATLKAEGPKRARWATIGGLVGGFFSGLVGSRA